MALGNINTAEEGEGSFKRYTGLTVMSGIVINPTKAQMEKMGMKRDDEPVYLSKETDEETGKEFSKLRVSVFFGKEIGEGENKHTLYVNHSVFLESRLNVSKKGLYEIIDRFGKSAFIPKDEWENKSYKIDWVDKETAKRAIVGESALVTLFRNLSLADKNEPLTLAEHLSPGGNRKALFTKGGDSELKTCMIQLKKANDAKAKLLLGVRIDYSKKKVYQDVFAYNIGRVYSDATYFHKELVRIYSKNREFFKTKYFGEIDFTNEKAKEEQYRLSIFEDDPFNGSGSGAAKPNSNSGSADQTSDDEDNFDLNEDDAELENAMNRGGSEDEDDF